MDEPRQDVAVLDVEVVVRPEDVGGNDGGEASAMLLGITPGSEQRRDSGWAVKPLPPAVICPPKNPGQQHLHLPSPGISPASTWKSHWIPLALKTSGCSHVPSSPILDIDHPLGVGVAKVGAMRRPVVDLGMSEWIN